MLTKLWLPCSFALSLFQLIFY